MSYRWPRLSGALSRLFPGICFAITALRNPHRRDFVTAGFGIMARAQRARTHWSRHQRLSKETITRWSTTLSPELRSVAIIGAGRLLDAPMTTLIERFAEIHLLDADPSCRHEWKRWQHFAAQRGVSIHCQEIELTGCIDHWSDALAAQLSGDSSLQGVKEQLRSLARLPLPSPELPRVDCIISLNLLSQIPIYWRERATKLLQRNSRALFLNEELHPELEEALTATMATLQTRHHQLIAASGARSCIMLTDDEFYFYKKEIAHWQVEPALLIEDPLTIPGYSTASADSWLWHLAPQGIEHRSYGSIHRVQARLLTRTTRHGENTTP